MRLSGGITTVLLYKIFERNASVSVKKKWDFFEKISFLSENVGKNLFCGIYGGVIMYVA